MKKFLLSLLLLLSPTLALAQNANWYVPPWLSSTSSGGGAAFISPGPILLPDGTIAAPSLAFANSATTGFYKGTGNAWYYGIVGTGPYLSLFKVGSEIGLKSTGTFSWFTDTATNSSPDLHLARDAANTLAQRNTTNPQTFNIYNTYTDASNYERLTLYGSGVSGIFITTQALGSGVGRSLTIGSASYVTISPQNIASNNIYGDNGHWYPSTNDQDLGYNSSSNNWWRTSMLSTSIQGFKTRTLADASATGFVQIALPQTLGSNFTSGTILWQVHCDNGSTTTYADRAGQTVFTCNNIAGTEACVFDATAQQVTQAATYSLAAPAWTATGGTDTVTLNVNADCAGVVGPTNMYIHYRLDILDPQTVTPQ